MIVRLKIPKKISKKKIDTITKEEAQLSQKRKPITEELQIVR